MKRVLCIINQFTLTHTHTQSSSPHTHRQQYWIVFAHMCVFVAGNFNTKKCCTFFVLLRRLWIISSPRLVSGRGWRSPGGDPENTAADNPREMLTCHFYPSHFVEINLMGYNMSACELRRRCLVDFVSAALSQARCFALIPVVVLS